MRKIDEELIKIIKQLDGSLLGIGLKDEKIITSIENNNKILNCNLLNSYVKEDKIKGRNKKIALKKLKKIYGKEKVNYIIYDLDEVSRYMRNFIRINEKINDKKTYIFAKSSEYDFDKIKKRYQRYTNNIKFEKKGEYYLITIDNTNSHKRPFMGVIYFIIDCLEDALDLFSDVLVN